MSKGKDFRPRKRGFDDDGPMPYEPRAPRGRGFGGGPEQGFGGPPMGAPGFSPGAPVGPTVDAVVKWFKADKGYGFVELANGQGDAFLHANALHASGHESVPTGAKLKVTVGAGAKGAQVTRVVEVDTAGVVERPQRSFSDGPRPPRRAAPDPSSAVRRRPRQVVRRRQGLRLRGERRRRQGCIRPHFRAQCRGHSASGRRPGGQHEGGRHPEGPRSDFAFRLIFARG